MILVLRVQEIYKKLVLLDTVSGAVTIISRDDYPEFDSRQTNGIVGKAGTKIVYFYRMEDYLYIKVDELIITITIEVTSSITSIDNKTNNFKLFRGKEILLSIDYERPVINPSLEISQFFNPFIEEEDFDIFLFINNVINNPRRREILYRH